ncbi:hypothetical protein F7Q92_16065 [Ideonella dechloratans]|uniref:Transmembrane protein n=1 Tax=Ideonella dechloratans TaxID=36863 RepID=A0A643F9W5_IDEDE|nr:hypothetical protein [Ideonella dechloratans]KAB0577782.1 hypothetical protein F7Q92_16065 [Ideonella dechloratans]UFU11960.1 hypothetical protein LRM40_19695 [Ideonella dechloratans]
MKTSPPPAFVQRRIWLLFAALGGLAIAALAIVFFKHSTEFPVSAVVAAAGLVFVWGNFSYWWLELRYPHMSDGQGRFVSRVELSGCSANTSSGAFFFGFAVAALFVTAALIRVVIDG